MTAPDVTVCVATRNQAAFLPLALDSLRRQTYPLDRFEVVVIDDGSTDGTPTVLKEFVPWIRFVSREHRGLVASCNDGLARATGRYFARLDSDDAVDSEWLASMVGVLDRAPHACLAYPDRVEFDAHSSWHANADARGAYSLLACGTLFRTDVLRDIGGFRPFFWEEYDLYLRLRQRGDWLHVPQPLYRYRRHDAGMTSDSSRRLQGWRELAVEWGAEALRASGSDPELDRCLAEQSEDLG